MYLPSTFSTVVFVVVLAVTLVLFAMLIITTSSHRRPIAQRNVFGMSVLWLALTALLPLARVLGGDATVIQAIVFAALMPAIVFFGFTRKFQSGMLTAPIAVLTALQVFRLPLELVLHQWWQEGFLPLQMTYNGDNFDIVTGVLALPAALLIWKFPSQRWVLWVFNIIGLVLVMRIVGIVALTNQTPIKALFGGYDTGPEIMVGLYLPYVWLPTVLVPIAILLHILSLRRLWHERGS